MSAANWVRKLFAPAARPAGRPARTSLGVEQLADRIVPANVVLSDHVLTVTGSADADAVTVTQTGDCVSDIVVHAVTNRRADPRRQYSTADVHKVVFVGLGGNDVISNTSYVRSEMYGGAGDDKLSGGHGNDYLEGGLGRDKVTGNAGDDRVGASTGEDELHGGAGRDTIVAVGTQHAPAWIKLSDSKLEFRVGTVTETDRVSGFDHAVLLGTAGNDTIDAYSFSGSTEQYGYAGDDVLNGGSGGDFIDGGTGNDRIYGYAGNDELRGMDGDDFVHGGEGNDALYGNYGRDELHGGDGDDHIDVGRSDWDVVYAGLGADWVTWNNHTFWGDDGGSLTGDKGQHGYTGVNG